LCPAQGEQLQRALRSYDGHAPGASSLLALPLPRVPDVLHRPLFKATTRVAPEGLSSIAPALVSPLKEIIPSDPARSVMHFASRAAYCSPFLRLVLRVSQAHVAGQAVFALPLPLFLFSADYDAAKPRSSLLRPTRPGAESAPRRVVLSAELVEAGALVTVHGRPATVRVVMDLWHVVHTQTQTPATPH
jgi:hypothetical protein